jgi:choice-of-anchor A domain-containing protein
VNHSILSIGTFVDGSDASASALIIGGRVFYTAGSPTNINQNGFVKIGNCTGSNIYQSGNTRITGGTITDNPALQLQTAQPTGSICRSGLINFSTAFTQMSQYASTLASCASNVILRDQNGTPLPNNSNPPANVKILLIDNTTNVLTLSATALNQIQSITFENQPNAARPLIINVTGSSMTWNTPTMAGIGSGEAGAILFNFSGFSSLTINANQMVEGTIFAPGATVIKQGSNNVEGQIIAANFTMDGGEIHNFPFFTDVSCPAPPCSNITNGGQIASSRNYCTSTNPPAFTNVTSPSGGSGTIEYAWAYSFDCGIPVDQWPLISGATAATYDPPTVSQSTCYVRLSRRSGCNDYTGVSNILTIDINTPPTLQCEANINGQGWTVENDCAVTLCAGGSLQLSVLPNVSTVSWTGPGFTATGNTITVSNNISTAQAGTYRAVLTDVNGCTGSVGIVVGVNAAPTATITGPSSVCDGSCITITASGGGAYAWSNGRATAANNVCPTTTTTYTVTVTAAGGCTATASRTITVNNVPKVKVDPQTICAGSSTTLTASTTATQYVWSNGGTTQTITVSPATTTTYTVTVTGSNGCTEDASATVTVNASPTVSVANATVCTGASGTLTATVGGGTSFTYSWSSGENTPSITKSTAGSYTVTVRNQNNCSATATGTITINTVTPGSVGSDQTICLSGDPAAFRAASAATRRFA